MIFESAAPAKFMHHTVLARKSGSFAKACRYLHTNGRWLSLVVRCAEQRVGGPLPPARGLRQDPVAQEFAAAVEVVADC
jgi:hypothetical protein